VYDAERAHGRASGPPRPFWVHHILQMASAVRIRRKPTSSGRNYGAGVSVASQATDVQPTAGGLLPRIRLAVSSPPRARAQFLCVGDERVPSRPRPPEYESWLQGREDDHCSGQTLGPVMRTTPQSSPSRPAAPGASHIAPRALLPRSGHADRSAQCPFDGPEASTDLP
jgi:hypothetical protein